MNVQMGLIRGWVVVSALWVIVVGGLLSPTILPTLEVEECVDLSAYSDDELIASLRRDRSPRPLTEYERRMLDRIDAACSAAILDADRRYAEHQASGSEEPYAMSEYEAFGTVIVSHPAPGSNWAVYAGAMFGPPLGLLLLGLAGFWVARGFRP